MTIIRSETYSLKIVYRWAMHSWLHSVHKHDFDSYTDREMNGAFTLSRRKNLYSHGWALLITSNMENETFKYNHNNLSISKEQNTAI